MKENQASRRFLMGVFPCSLSGFPDAGNHIPTSVAKTVRKCVRRKELGCAGFHDRE
jgi:hypothetical protein